MFVLIRLFTISIVVISCYGQVVTPEYILGAPIQKVEKLKIPKSDTVMVLPFGFGDFITKDQKVIDSINRKPIAKIVMVYTRYKKVEDFSQEKLNRNRLEQFQKQCPYIFNNNLISWEIVEQTKARNDEEAKKYFHGFLIYFKGKSVKKIISADKEIAMIMAGSGDGCRLTSKDTIYDKKDLHAAKPVELEMFIMEDTLIKLKNGAYKGKYIRYTIENYAKRDQLSPKILAQRIVTRKVTIDGKVLKVSYRKEARKVGSKTYYDPKSLSKRTKGIFYTRPSIWKREVHYDLIEVVDTLWIALDTGYRIKKEHTGDVFRRDCFTAAYNAVRIDTVVKLALPMIEHPQNTIVVEDVTGSMNPYLLQTFLWRRKTLATSTLSRFVFFNDGDNTPDHMKVIGLTKGIYAVNSLNIDTVEKVAYAAMRRGSGGDTPENNLEALLFAERECPTCDLLMIADNNAPVKDISLLEKIKKPVNIILCGAYSSYYQSDYLTIARATKGKIITMEGELKDVVRSEDGKRIKVGEQYFVVQDGRFILSR